MSLMVKKKKLMQKASTEAGSIKEGSRSMDFSGTPKPGETADGKKKIRFSKQEPHQVQPQQTQGNKKTF